MTVDTLDILDRIKQVTINKLGVEKEKITPESDFSEDLGADSLDTVELIMAFEEEFEIEIPDEEAEQIRTVQQAVDYIQNNMPQ